MAIVTRTNLKSYFQTGDKPTEAQFIDLIDSFVHIQEGDDNQQITDTLKISGSETYVSGSSNALLGMVVSGAILPGDTHSDLGAFTSAWDKAFINSLHVSGNIIPSTPSDSFTSSFSLGSPEAAWKDLYVSEDSIKFIKKSGSGDSKELARITIDTASGKMKFLGETDHKDLELRQVQFGKSLEKGAFINDGGGERSTFVALSLKHREVGVPGGHVLLRPESFGLDFMNTPGGKNKFVAHAVQAKGSGSIAMLIDADNTMADNAFFSVERAPFPGGGTELFKVFPDKSKFYGTNNKVEFESSIIATGGSVIEEGIIVQPGIISQSFSIGTTTSPSVNIMDGVGDSCFIRIAEGITVRVNEGSLFKIQCPQPDVTVDTDNDTITVSNGTGDETIINTGQFGTNPQYISNHMVVPSGQVAIWYGPIYIGRFTLNPFGTDFNADGAGVLNMDLAGQGDNASLRIQNGAQIKVQAF